MKASACSLETKISKLTDEEVNQLKNEGIRGKLKFRESCSGGKRRIPFTLYCSPNQRELVEVRVVPADTYFGDAKVIEFFINEEYYESLKEGGCAIGARFCFGTGKLELYSKTYR